ncbi:MAG: hypothetical protein ACMG6S_23665 [Byssovorax sp.]
MKCIHVLGYLGAITLTACGGVDSGEMSSAAEGEEQRNASLSNVANDPLGIALEEVGLSAGDRPCGDDAQVASVVDEAGRYLAFCSSSAGYTSVLQVTPGDVAPLRSSSDCALDTYLAAAPADAPVPQALVDACKGSSVVGRRISADPVAVGTKLTTFNIIVANTACSSATYFQDVHCAAIADYATDPQIADAVSWCALGPYSSSAQRTASTQGLPGAFEGRTTVAACGTGTTNLKGLVRKSISGTWVTIANVNINPYYVATRTVHHYDVEESDAWSTYYGDDLRFTVTPSSGATYRYTGAFIEFVPVP